MSEFSDIRQALQVDFSGGERQFNRVMERVSQELNEPVALDDDVLDMLSAAGSLDSTVANELAGPNRRASS